MSPSPIPAEDAPFEAHLRPSQARLYRFAWREFVDFCAQRQYPALPSTEEVVTAFANWLAWQWLPGGFTATLMGGPRTEPGKSATSMMRALLAIGSAHRASGCQVPDMREAWAIQRRRAELGTPRKVS